MACRILAGAGVAVCGFVTAAAYAADPSAPIDTGLQEHVTVQLVQINFIAVDRSGRPVLDLKPEEVEITDGREKQRVAFLQPYYQPAPTDTPGPTAASAKPPSAPTPPERRRSPPSRRRRPGGGSCSCSRIT